MWGESSCSAGTELGVSVKPTGKWKTMLHFEHFIQNSGFDNDSVVPHLAPEHVQAQASSSSSMEVTISPPSIASGISFYRASAGDSS